MRNVRCVSRRGGLGFFRLGAKAKAHVISSKGFGVLFLCVCAHTLSLGLVSFLHSTMLARVFLLCACMLFSDGIHNINGTFILAVTRFEEPFLLEDLPF
jgi:hypothetical protein